MTMPKVAGRAARRWDWESLESRVALSHSAAFGAVGDSLTDEYRSYPPDRSQARNWVETLASTRNVDFGAYTTQDRGLPRDQGFANDWAKEDATTQGVVGGQLPGLARQVAEGKVAYAAVGMGTNDFLFFAEAVAAQTLAGAPPTNFEAELAAVEANAVANFDTTVETLLSANPDAKVIVETTPDIRQVPIVAQYLGIPGLALAANTIADAQAAYNANIRQVAADLHQRVALADLAAQADSFRGGTSTTLPIGGIQVSLTTTGDNFHDAVLADKIHPGTILQGLIANSIIEAADTLGAQIKPLSPTEIVARARDVAAHPGTAR
jgi:phospholipase/lecithinase/hemolysin